MADGEGPAADLVAAATGTGRTVWICGVGFDPRALQALEHCISRIGQVDLRPIHLPPQSGDRRAAQGTTLNQDKLKVLAEGKPVTDMTLPMVSDRRNQGAKVIRELISAASLDEANHIVLDISSLPTAIYFPILRGLLERPAIAANRASLQVIGVENPRIDAMIVSQGSDAPSYLPGFRGPTEGDRPPTQIWAPVVGLGESVQMRAINADLAPDEICPVLPFPATDPRRADDLVRQHRELLFQTFNIDPRNLIYANEANPFDLYRTLLELHERYSDALQPLKGARLVLSSHASKMLSLGVLLAATEADLPVIHAPAAGYVLSGDLPAGITSDNNVTAIWLTGPPYVS